ncbi:EAGR box-containing protein [Mycoplasma bradburyae]|uniref:EAGR box-containing protein n=1 Tax=Mycoplasma bradburyae TaxID=2963128 RepID=UPI0023403DD8|nr:EAGR box-containing protein [Mycoplasma bradburyae]MDC4182362.1 EAGR box-containing protein [Mycoplasma bradburyae]
MAKKTKKKNDLFEDQEVNDEINDEDSEAIFGNLYDGADDVVPAALAYESGQLPEDGSIQVAFDADNNAYYISYDAENEIFIEPYEQYELDASSLYDAEGNPFDFFANYYVEQEEGAEEESSGEYWEQFIGVEGYGYYDENNEWIWSGYFDDNNEFIPEQAEEAVEEEPEVQAEQEESVEEPQADEVAEEEVVEEEQQSEELQAAPEEEYQEEAVEEEAAQEETVEAAQEEYQEEAAEEAVEVAEEEYQEEAVEEQAEEQAGSAEVNWEDYIGVEGYGWYDENNEWVWAGYFDDNGEFVPYEYEEEQPAEEAVEAAPEEEYQEEAVEEQAEEDSGEYWEQFIGVEGYGWYDENNEWVWAGYFDENNQFIPNEYSEDVAEEVQAAPEEYAEEAQEQADQEVAQEEYQEEAVEEAVEQPAEEEAVQAEAEEQVEEAVEEAVEEQPEEVEAQADQEAADEVVEEEASEEYEEEQVEAVQADSDAFEKALAEADQSYDENALVPVEEHFDDQAADDDVVEEEPALVEKALNWEDYVGVEGYGFYDENNEWVWTGYFDENNVFIPQEGFLDLLPPPGEEQEHSEEDIQELEALIESEELAEQLAEQEQDSSREVVEEQAEEAVTTTEEQAGSDEIVKVDEPTQPEEESTQSEVLATTEEQPAQEVVTTAEEQAGSDEIVKVDEPTQPEEESTQSEVPATTEEKQPAVADDQIAIVDQQSEQVVQTNIEQFIGNIDFGYYDEASEWIWTGQFDSNGNFYDFDGNLVYKSEKPAAEQAEVVADKQPSEAVLTDEIKQVSTEEVVQTEQQTQPVESQEIQPVESQEVQPVSTDEIKPVVVEEVQQQVVTNVAVEEVKPQTPAFEFKPSDLSDQIPQTSLVVSEADILSENIVQEVNSDLLDFNKVEIAGLLNSAQVPVQVEQPKIQPVFEQEKIALPAFNTPIQISTAEPLIQNELIDVKVQVEQPAVDYSKRSESTALAIINPVVVEDQAASDLISVDANNFVPEATQAIFNQPKPIQPIQFDEIKLLQPTVIADVKFDTPQAQTALALVQPAPALLGYDKITHISDDLKVNVDISSLESTDEQIRINLSQEALSGSSKFDLFSKKPEVQNEFVQRVEQKLDLQVIEQPVVLEQPKLSLDKQTYADESSAININVDESVSVKEKAIQINPVVNETSDFDINNILKPKQEEKPAEVIIVELPKNQPEIIPSLYVSVVHEEAKPVEQIIDDSLITADEIIVQPEAVVEVFETTELDSDKIEFEVVEEQQELVEELNISPEQIQQAIIESETKAINKDDEITLVDDEPFFNKFIGDENYGYYTDKGVWIWNGYFDEEGNFVSDKQDKISKVDELIEEMNQQAELEKAQAEAEPFFNKFIGDENYGYYTDKGVWIWNGYFDDEGNFVSDKQDKISKVDELIEEMNQQAELEKAQVEKETETFFNKFIGDENYGYYTDKGVWIWNGYFDDEGNFVSDKQDKISKVDELIEEMNQQAELEKAQAEKEAKTELKLIESNHQKEESEEVKAKETFVIENFIQEPIQLLNPAKEAENLLTVYQTEKIDINSLREEFNKIKAREEKEEFDNFSYINDLDVINLDKASTSKKSNVYVFSGFEKKEEQFDKKNLSYLEELKINEVVPLLEETRVSNLSEFLKQDPQVLLLEAHEAKPVNPNTSLAIIPAKDEIKLITEVQVESIEKEVEVIEQVNALQPIEQVQEQHERSSLEFYVPKFDDQKSFESVGFALPASKQPEENEVQEVELIDVITPIEQDELSSEKRSALDSYKPTFEDSKSFESVDFELPVVKEVAQVQEQNNYEEFEEVDSIDVIAPIEDDQIEKVQETERSLLNNYKPSFDSEKALDNYGFNLAKQDFSNVQSEQKVEELAVNDDLVTALDPIEQDDINISTREELKVQLQPNIDPIDVILDEVSALAEEDDQPITKIHSFSSSDNKKVEDIIIKTEDNDNYIQLDEQDELDQLINHADDSFTNVVVELEEESQPIVVSDSQQTQQQENITNQIAVPNEEYKKDIAELKQFLEKRSEELFKQYFAKFEELSKRQIESFNNIKDELRSEMDEIRDEVKANQLTVTSEISEEIYPSAPKITRKQQLASDFINQTNEFEFDNSLSLINENNYDLYELLDRIINYEDVQLTTSNVFKSEEYQAKIKQSVNEVKMILKNSEREATKNYNYILSTLKNEISLLQKDLPLIIAQINKIQNDLRSGAVNKNDYRFAQEQIQQLRTEHANKSRAISFYNKKISDLKSIYAQQIRKIKSDYKRINDLINNKQEKKPFIQPQPQPRMAFDNSRFAPRQDVKRNYEQLYKTQLQQNPFSYGNNYGSFKRFDSLIDNNNYEYFIDHQPREFFNDLESIDNDIFSSNDLIYSNRNTYLDENFKINDFEITSGFDDIDAIYGMDRLRLPALESGNSMNDLDFTNMFDIDFDTDY